MGEEEENKFMMDAKLKAKLVEAIEKAYERRDKLQIRYSFRTKTGAKTAPFPVQKLHALVYADAHRNLVRDRLWRELERALAREGMERMVADLIRRRQRGAEDPAQLRLPGFEFLPQHVRIRRQRFAFGRITVAQFLGYKKWYESHWEKDRRVMDELQRLADSVARFAEESPDLTVAAALARAGGAPRLAVVGAPH